MLLVRAILTLAYKAVWHILIFFVYKITYRSNRATKVIWPQLLKLGIFITKTVANISLCSVRNWKRSCAKTFKRSSNLLVICVCVCVWVRVCVCECECVCVFWFCWIVLYPFFSSFDRESDGKRNQYSCRTKRNYGCKWWIYYCILSFVILSIIIIPFVMSNILLAFAWSYNCIL